MSKIKSALATCGKAIFDCVQNFIEPHPAIVHPEDRYRSRLLNSLLVIYLPLAVVVILFRVMITPEEITTTVVITCVGIAVVFLIYLIGRVGYYRLSVYVTISLGFGVIYLNALNSSPPHIEIIYLIFLPLIGIVIFSLREVLIVYLIAMILLVIFLTSMEDVGSEIAKDLFVFLLLAQGFVIFASYHRERLETHRRDLILERERNEMVGELVSNISHDLKTPLTVIRNSIYLLGRIKTQERLEQELTKLNHQTERLQHLIDDMLTVSQLEHEVAPQFTPFDFSQLVQDVIQQLSVLAQTKKIRITTELAQGSHRILGVWDDLERMVVNLMENALNYTPEGGIVSVLVQPAGNNAIHLQIQDTGIGMSDEELSHIFERFYRADTARSSHTGGTGLGLAIVKRVVERHHGDIQVKSEIGQGTTFCITLPVSHT